MSSGQAVETDTTCTLPLRRLKPPSTPRKDNPRSDRSVTSEVTEVSPIEPDENLSNSVPDDVSEAPAPLLKELLKNSTSEESAAPGPSRAEEAAPALLRSTITSQEQFASNVEIETPERPIEGRTVSPLEEQAEPTPAFLDNDFWDVVTPKRGPGKGAPPPRKPRHHQVNAGGVAWTFEILAPSISKSQKQEPQEEDKTEPQLALPPERFLSLEEGNERFAAIRAMIAEKVAAQEHRPSTTEVFNRAIETRRRRTRYGGE